MTNYALCYLHKRFHNHTVRFEQPFLRVCFVPDVSKIILEVSVCLFMYFPAYAAILSTRFGPKHLRNCITSPGTSTSKGLCFTRSPFRKWATFTMVRNPIERFVSGYANQCFRRLSLNFEMQIYSLFEKEGVACFGCRGDVNCFLQRFYRALRKGLPINEYVFHHFIPQTWFVLLSP